MGKVHILTFERRNSMDKEQGGNRQKPVNI